MKKGILRILDDGKLAFWCKGCEKYHAIEVNPNKNHYWGFNGDYDKPTFTPSVLVQSGHYMSSSTGDCWCTYYQENPDVEQDNNYKCIRCHSFITDGYIQYLSDCSHGLAGQTIELIGGCGE